MYSPVQCITQTQITFLRGISSHLWHKIIIWLAKPIKMMIFMYKHLSSHLCRYVFVERCSVCFALTGEQTCWPNKVYCLVTNFPPSPSIASNRLLGKDSFHLCIFNFPFIYHFYSIMTILVKSICWNAADLFIFKTFQNNLIRCVT